VSNLDVNSNETETKFGMANASLLQYHQSEFPTLLQQIKRVPVQQDIHSYPCAKEHIQYDILAL
jgi:hypothetical protein